MFDYIVLGGGSAGCVLASRLSEDTDVKVCLVEAGGNDTKPSIQIPSAFGTLFRTSSDWDYASHDEEQLNRRRPYLPRGHVLGGTSSINTMIYIRGNRCDYDRWGVEGWSYGDLLPYFKAAEDNERGADDYHGVGGPLAVSDSRSNNPMSTAFVEAGVQAGYEHNNDFNGESQDGFGMLQLTQRNGARCSAATAYLSEEVRARPNLTIKTHTEIHRIEFDGKRATGVEGEQAGEPVKWQADREVIVCAGAYNSPKLLQQSGVGPAQLLDAFHIPVVADIGAVGQNLSDHMLIPLVYTHDEPVSLMTATTPENFAAFQQHGKGPLTSNGPEVAGFVRTDNSLDAPDVEYLGAPVMFVDSGLAPPTEHSFTFGPTMLTPKSRGYVTMATPDLSAKPRIVHNYFSDPEDMRTAVAATRIGLELAQQSALSKYTTRTYRPPASDSDEDLETYIRQFAHSIFHPTGTCAMGAVVDAELKVNGVEGLRVVDASVIPVGLRGNPNAPTMAIAEKAADLIRGRKPRQAESPNQLQTA